MFIAHGPAGYLIARLAGPAAERKGVPWPRFVTAAVIGAVAPDADFLWYYLIGHGNYSHHVYPTHWPLTWLLVTALAWWWCKHNFKWGSVALVFGLGGLSHMLLDTFASGIQWLAPLSTHTYRIVLLHHYLRNIGMGCAWNPMLELPIVATALIVWRIPRKPRRQARRR